MSIDYLKVKLSSLFDDIEKHKVVLPSFQRDYVWDKNQQQRLLASFLVNLPIGSTLHLKGSDTDFVSRMICETKIITPLNDCEYVLDGQQRLSTLKAAFYDVFNAPRGWSAVWDDMFHGLRARWFLSVDSKLFGIDDLQFFPGTLETIEPSELMDYIEKFTIHKTKKDEWFHPGFCPKNADGTPFTTAQLELEVVRKCSERKIIPLYQVSADTNGIPYKALKNIARERADELKAEIEDGKRTLSEVLGHLSTNVDSLTEEEINDLWKDLQIEWSSQIKNFLNKLLERDLPYTSLPSNEVSRAISIFEEINKNGTQLALFDLFSARAAKSKKSADSLSSIIIKELKKNIDVRHIDPSIDNWSSDLVANLTKNSPSKKLQKLFMKVLAIRVALKNGEQIDRKTVSADRLLKMEPDDIIDNAPGASKSLARSLAFLQLSCGVVSEDKINFYEYLTSIIAVALSIDDIWKKHQEKLNAWYWTTIFTGKYSIQRLEDTWEKDIELILTWCTDAVESFSYPHADSSLDLNSYISDNEDRIFNVDLFSDLGTLLLKNDEVETHLKNAILQFILSRKPKDLISLNDSNYGVAINLSAFSAANDAKCYPESNYKMYKLEEHHLIPLATATLINQSTKDIRDDKKHILNSPLNLCWISEYANRQISSMDLATYASEVSKVMSEHLMSTDHQYYQKSDSESEGQYYERCLKERFRILKDEVIRSIRSYCL